MQSDSRRNAKVIGLALLAVAVLAVVGTLIAKFTGGSDADLAVSGFADTWHKGNDRGAASRTDDPTVALRALRANRRGLDGASLDTDVVETKEDGDTAHSRVKVTWRVPRIGPFSYTTRVGLRKVDGKWKVHWVPTVIHPRLDATSRLGTVRTQLARGDVLDRDGRPIVTARPVKRVGAIAGKVSDPAATARGLADALDVQEKPLEQSIRRGGKLQFVEALALRKDDYTKAKPKLAGVPDVTVVDGEAQLAPSRPFGRALLGGVAPATAEQLRRLGPRYATGDSVGQWGLEQRFETTLGPIADQKVVVRAGGAPIATLLDRRGRAGRPLRTTLSTKVQSAAESALAARADKAALVAVQPSTGQILAVANRPVDSTYDRALEGNYPPGSTFKVVTTAALLEKGLKPSQTVDCPKTLTVDGRSFKNFEGGSGGPQPFARDFANSCNTAFVSLAPRLAAPALPAAGRRFGLGQPAKLALPTARSQVPVPRTPVEKAASMIGQSRILASPLAMAGVAATVADGRWRRPRLVASDKPGTAPAPRAMDLATLRTLMRSVITTGTGTALASVPGSPAGKSGTAEFGGGDPPPTHAWFIAFRGDVAIAVLVENGKSGGSVAAPLAERFFSAVGG